MTQRLQSRWSSFRLIKPEIRRRPHKKAIPVTGRSRVTSRAHLTQFPLPRVYLDTKACEHAHGVHMARHERATRTGRDISDSSRMYDLGDTPSRCPTTGRPTYLAYRKRACFTIFRLVLRAARSTSCSHARRSESGKSTLLLFAKAFPAGPRHALLNWSRCKCPLCPTTERFTFVVHRPVTRVFFLLNYRSNGEGSARIPTKAMWASYREPEKIFWRQKIK